MIPLTLQVDDVQIVDDETFDQKRFLELVKASPNCPKTACPSPETFKQAFTCDAEDIFVITLSSHLSGSYNSAMVGLQMYEEEYGHKNIHILDSWSAPSGELRAALLIRELEEQGVPFEEIVEKLEVFKTQMRTYFVLETLDALRKNGRLTGLQAFFATTLNIKPVMGADKGVIIKLAARESIPFEITNIILIDSAGVLPVRTTAQKWKIRKYKILKKFLNMKLIYAMFPEVIDDWRSRQGSADYRNATPMMRQCMVKAVNEDLTELLPKIRQEVLLIWGDQDTATPIRDAHIMEEKIPNCGLAVIPGTGHFSFLEKPAQFRGIMEAYLQ